MNSFWALAPLLSVIAGALCVILLAAFLRHVRDSVPAFISLIFLAGTAGFCFAGWNEKYSFFEGGLVLDRPAILFHLVLILGVAAVILISLKARFLSNGTAGEYHGLLLLALAGLMIMVSSDDLLVIFLGLETLSVAGYALAGFDRGDDASSEASLKYFLLGSLGSAFLIFGLAFLYGATLSTRLPEIAGSLLSGPGLTGLAGAGLLLVGLSFKLALVPFHMWAPDVYQGAPTPIAAFFTFCPKAAGFAVLLKVFLQPWNGSVVRGFISPVLAATAGLTMIIGSLGALKQNHVKRMLAYSSIAHSGYILLALLAGDGKSLVFYLAVYLFMNTGAFAVLAGMSRRGVEFHEIKDFTGLGYSHPWMAGPLSLFLLSLAGIPPTGGFLAKFFVFSAAVREGWTWLVLVAVLASLVSVYYYLRVIVLMYMQGPAQERGLEFDRPGLLLVVYFFMYAVIQAGIFPGNLLAFISQAFASLGIL